MLAHSVTHKSSYTPGILPCLLTLPSRQRGRLPVNGIAFLGISLSLICTSMFGSFADDKT